MTAADLEELRALVAEQHKRLDSWLATLEGCLDEASGLGAAEADPRLEAADDALAEIDVRRQFAAADVLGITDGELDEEDLEGDGGGVLADDFFVHLVVGVADDTDAERLDSVLHIVDRASGEIVDRLVDDGFVVPQWGVSRGELLLDDFDEEDE